MKKSRWWLLVLVPLLLGGIAWAVWPSGRDNQLDPQLAPLQDKMRQLRDPGASLSAEQRDELRVQIRKELDTLQPEQRRQLFASGRQHFRQQMQQRLDQFFAAPPEQRVAMLDRHIQEMEQRRQEMERRRQEWEQAGGARGGARPPMAGPAGQRPPRSLADRQQRRNERRRRFLDNTSPEERAKFSEYIRQLRERRRELGLPEMPPRGRGRRAGPR